MNKGISQDTKAGLYITLIIHLFVCIVLLTVAVRPQISKRLEIEIDYTDEAAKLEQLQKELQFKKSVNDKLKELLGNSYQPETRNAVVDDNEILKDAKGIDAKQLYEDAARIQKDFEEIQNRADEVNVDAPVQKKATPKKEADKKEVYAGPAVVNYSLPGRKASYIPSPAFKCKGAGEVTVIIGVNPQGLVETTKIQEEISSEDQCLIEYALSCAKRTRFNQKAGAKARETGTIKYTFIAQ